MYIKKADQIRAGRLFFFVENFLDFVLVVNRCIQNSAGAA